MFKSNAHLILFQRFWQAIAGVVTILILSRYLTLQEQGWYYSFLSLASSYALFDLGLSIVLVQLAAHLFNNCSWLEDGTLDGIKKDEFSSLLNKSYRIYCLVALAFCILMLPFGFIFFDYVTDSKSAQLVSWFLPWGFLIIVTSLYIISLPFMALAEGSGLVREVYFVRLIQGVFGSFLCWLVLMYGHFLWATAMMPMAGILTTFLWLCCYRTQLIKSLKNNNKVALNWSVDIWPLQWRVGISWLSGYLLMQIYVPILFHYHGSELAGQMGLSLTIANMLGILSQSWIAHRVPAMAKAVGRKDWNSFDNIFKKDFRTSIVIYFLGAVTLIGLHNYFSSTKYAERVLSFWPFVGLLIVVLVNHITGSLSSQLRSYKKEPLVWVSLAGAILTVPVAVIAARYYSISVVILAILAIQLFLTLPFSLNLWVKYNKIWRE